MGQPRLLLLGRHPLLTTAVITLVGAGLLLACAAGTALFSLWRAESAPSGIAHEELILVYPLRLADGRHVSTLEVLDVMQGIEGVEYAAAANQSPYGYSSWNSSVGIHQRPSPDLMSSIYFAGERWLETLGTSTHSGRGFLSSEYRTFTGDTSRPHDTPLPTILTFSLAQRLYPDQDPLGRDVYLQPGIPLRVVGVVDDLPLPLNGRHLNEGRLGLLLPLRVENAVDAHFLVRVSADERDRIARAIEQALRVAYPSRVAAAPVALSSLHAEALAPERNRLLLSALMLSGWLLLTASTFTATGQWWLQRHAQELSLRRALGASTCQVSVGLRLEYLLLTGMGLATGIALSRVLPTTPWLPLAEAPAIVTLTASTFLIGLVQLAVSGSIHKASHIPPHLVSRSPSVRL